MPDHYCDEGQEQPTQVIKPEEWTIQVAADVLGISKDARAAVADQAAQSLKEKIDSAGHLDEGEKDTCIENIKGAASFFKKSKDQNINKSKPVSIL